MVGELAFLLSDASAAATLLATLRAPTQMLSSSRLFTKTHSGSDNLARCGALESLVNDMADDTWDNKAVNRISAIHFLDDGEDDDDEKVRVTGSAPPAAFLLY